MKKTRPAKRKKVLRGFSHVAAVLMQPPQKVWNRGATFAKWELDSVSLLARQVQHGVLDKAAARNVLQILKTKKI